MTEVTENAAPKKRRAQGTRTPSPIYIFVGRTEDGKLVANKTFRDPRKMAAHLTANRDSSDELLIVTPE